MDARDEINQLNTKTRQLQSQLKHYKDRAERTEQRYDQLQTDHAELQEKHRKMLERYVVLAKSSSKTNIVRTRTESLARNPPFCRSMSHGDGSLNDSFEHVQRVSPTADMLSSSPKPAISPVSGNGPKSVNCSLRNRKNFQKEIEESTKMTVVARKFESLSYTKQESNESGFWLDMDVQEAAKALASNSEVRSTPVGSSSAETIVMSSLDTTNLEENEMLRQRLNQPGHHHQTVSSLGGDVAGISETMVDKYTEFDRQDEEMLAREKKVTAQSWTDQAMQNDESLYDELGHDSATEIDEPAEISRASMEIQLLLDENRMLQEKGNQVLRENDELMAKVGILSSENDDLTEEINSAKFENDLLKEEIKNIKRKLEKEREQTESPEKRKRYTRPEMAQILEERTFFKEKYLELQEKLDYAEKTPSVQPEKKHERSLFFQFFQNLFRKSKS
jgi:chromosome segregation ATPase